MSITFTLTLGYASGALSIKENDDKPTFVQDKETLSNIIENVRNEPEALRDTIDLFASKEVTSHPDLDDYINLYRGNGAPLDKYDDEWSINCSGGGMSRTLKETVAVAFCNRVFLECASIGLHLIIISC